MSGPLGSSQWMYASGGYELEQSLKFNEDRSPYLSRTPSSAGNRKTFTYSCWMKIGNIGNDNNIIHARESANDRFHFLMSSNYLGVSYYVGGTEKWIRTTPLLRDPSAWYHIVLRVDTTQSTSTDRVRIYVNGEVQHLYAGQMPTQNWDLAVNNNVEHRIGQRISNNDYKIDGYLAEIHLVDGTSLAPTSFGETGTYGEWKPIEYEGTYGTNGFYLPFKNDYAVEGFSAVTYNGNGTAGHYIGGTGFKPDFVWIKARDNDASQSIFDSVRGVGKALAADSTAVEDDSISSYLKTFENDGFTLGTDSTVNYSDGRKYVAWNWDMGGDSYGSSAPHALTVNGAVNHSTAQKKMGTTGILFDGTDDWINSPSVSSLGLDRDFTIETWFYTSSNSRQTIIGGAPSIGLFLGFDQGTTDRNVGMYMSSNGSSWDIIDADSGGDGVGSTQLALDAWHHIAVVKNGTNLKTYLNGTVDINVTISGEITQSTTAMRIGSYGTADYQLNGYLDEFRISNTARYSSNFTPSTSAFSVDANTALLIHSNTTNGSTAFIDSSGADYNTDGSIDSRVRANPTYGQSIVTWSGSGVTATIGHGLSSAPEMIIVKRRDASTHWPVWHTSISSGTDDFLQLNLSSAEVTNEATFFTSTDPTSSVFSVGSGGGQTNAGNMLAYCFHSVTGYSKFNKFTGNGSATGPVVTTGFNPAFVMWKRIDNTSNWFIADNVRNFGGLHLEADTVDAEAASNTVKFLSTGFQPTDDTSSNANNVEYIYMAFADTREYAYWLDQSGNNNDWTSNNLTESDISVDSPTNNFATFNPIDASGNDNTYSEGNLKVYLHHQGEDERSKATMGASSGKWYWEHYAESSTDDGGNFYVGIRSPDESKYWIIRGSNGEHETTGGTQSTIGAVAWDVGDIVGVAVDLDNSKWWVSINGTFVGSPTSGTSPIHSDLSGTVLPTTQNANSGERHTFVANFGQDSSFAGNKTAQGNQDSGGIGDFYYAPPTGFKALCTSNLPDVDVTPSEHFNTVLWSGDDASSHAITGVGFQSDMLWLKERTSTSSHQIHDAIRSAGTALFPNSDAAEGSSSTYLQSFDTDGFTVGSSGSVNNDGDTYVGWNWKGGNATLGTGDFTQGTIASTCSRNVDAGFSIVSYTGTAASSGSIGHGLSSVPEMIIVKNRSKANGEGWCVYHHKVASDPETDQLSLNSTAAAWDAVEAWNDTAPTATLFYVDNDDRTNDESETFIAYCFHSVDGYSKVGTHQANNNADGTFAYTGFKPALVLAKVSAGGSGYEWIIYDNKRDIDNPLQHMLKPSTNVVENTGSNRLDFLSNGFKFRESGNDNGSGLTLIWIAFAETPFKYSNAR